MNRNYEKQTVKYQYIGEEFVCNNNQSTVVDYFGKIKKELLIPMIRVSIII